MDCDCVRFAPEDHPSDDLIALQRALTDQSVREVRLLLLVEQLEHSNRQLKGACRCADADRRLVQAENTALAGELLQLQRRLVDLEGGEGGREGVASRVEGVAGAKEGADTYRPLNWPPTGNTGGVSFAREGVSSSPREGVFSTSPSYRQLSDEFRARIDQLEAKSQQYETEIAKYRRQLGEIEYGGATDKRVQTSRLPCDLRSRLCSRDLLETTDSELKQEISKTDLPLECYAEIKQRSTARRRQLSPAQHSTEAKLAEICTKCARLERDLADKVDENRFLSATCDGLHGMIEAAEQRKAGLRDQVATLARDIEAKSAEIARLCDVIRRQCGERQQLEEKLAKMASSAEDLSSKSSKGSVRAESIVSSIDDYVEAILEQQTKEHSEEELIDESNFLANVKSDPVLNIRNCPSDQARFTIDTREVGVVKSSKSSKSLK